MSQKQDNKASSESPKQVPPKQLPLESEFESVIAKATVISREEVEAEGQQPDGKVGYDPVAQTSEYMHRVVEIEKAWETTVQRAQQELLTRDARELYLDFFMDIKRQIEQNVPRSSTLAALLESVAIRGLGMTKSQVRVEMPARGGTRWKVYLDVDSIRDHLESHIIGEHFLNTLTPSTQEWRGTSPIIGASDVSQHRSSVPVPARYFKRNVPFILNNAAGTIYTLRDSSPQFSPIFNPKPDEELLRWMLIDPSYQDELEPEDYERCVASAMDVGQYKFDIDYLMKSDNRPDIIFRDGSLFPQDAFIDNYLIETKRGIFTRQAIKELLSCLQYAEGLGLIYCGVAKNVQLKVYSAVVDWFIEKEIDPNWSAGNYTLNDGQAMSLLLASPSFVGDNLQSLVATCLIRRRFTTRATLNSKIPMSDTLSTYLDRYQHQHLDIDITPYRQLCEIGEVFMFFMGHSKSPQQQLPRYEFFCPQPIQQVPLLSQRILSAVRTCGLTDDHDHSFMVEKPVTYLLPSVTQHAHLLSKDVGRYIDSQTGQQIMARYRSLLTK